MFEFVQALAALTYVCKDEVQNKTVMQGKLLKDVVASAAAPGRVQWYFNNLRMRHALPTKCVSLLASGTSANEAFHAEMNRWFRNQPELYLSTFIFQLRVNWIAKLMVHNFALYTPLLRQMNQDTVLVALASKWKFDIKTYWQDWVHTGVALPLSEKRKVTQQALRKRNTPKRILNKTPAYAVSVRKSVTKPVKRTPNKLRRVKV